MTNFEDEGCINLQGYSKMKKRWKVVLGIFLGITVIISSLLIFQLVRITTVDYEWLEGEPEDYGFKWNKIAATRLVAEQMPYLRSVLILRTL
jgi:hypothetical protein